jgi:hypothetical protein
MCYSLSLLFLGIGNLFAGRCTAKKEQGEDFNQSKIARHTLHNASDQAVIIWELL